MYTTKQQHSIVAVWVVALVLTFCMAAALGSNQWLGQPSQDQPSRALPSHIHPGLVGDGGLKISTLELSVDTAAYKIWTARDWAEDYCMIVLALPEGTSSAACADEEEFSNYGLGVAATVPGSQLSNNTSVTTVDAYLLPDGADMRIASEAIPGASIFGKIAVQYGPIVRSGASFASIPSTRGKNVELALISSW